jgi:hypothetical protein
MGGSDTTQTTQQQQVQQFPPWINQAAQQNYAFAQNTANRPLQQYQGQMVANVGPQMQDAWNLAANSGNVGQDQYNASQAGYMGVLGQQPQQVTAGQLSNTNLQPYMNPYTQNVINATLPIMQQNLGLQQNQQQNAASSAGAFGGSRQGIQQGVTQAQGAQNMAQMAAQLNQANFGQAQSAAQQDISGRMQAALANQAAQQNQGGLNLQAAGGLASLGQQAQLNQARNFTELATAGAQQQQQAQNQINAQMGKFNQAWMYPYQQLGVLQSALGMTPYGTATQGQQTQETQQAASPLNMAITGMQALGSLFPGGQMSGLGSAIGGAFGGSDRSMKTDITRIGTHPTGIPIHAYRYKGDPKTYPKVVGPMAEDVAKIAPHAVHVIPGSGGKRMVHMPTLNALGAMGGGIRGVSRGTPPIAPPAPMPGVAGPMPAGPSPGATPGMLASPGPMGAMGAMAGPMAGPAPRPRKMRPPQLMGALGG